MPQLLDSQLNASSPHVASSRAIDSAITRMSADAARSARRTRRRSIALRVAIPVVLAAGLVSSGSALASPTVRHNLGLLPQPSATIALPATGCTFTTYLTGWDPVAVNDRNLETEQFATSWLERQDVRRIEATPAFASLYSGNSAVIFPITPTPAELRRFNASFEARALSQLLLPKLVDAAAARGYNAEILGWTGAVHCPATNK